MSETRTFLLPDVGEGLTEAEMLSWKVAPGDVVVVNQTLCEIETAKAAVELPCPFAGTIGELLVPVGEVVPVGTPIVTIVMESAEGAPVPADPPAPHVDSVPTGEKAQREAVLVGYGVKQSDSPQRRRRIPSNPHGTDTHPAGPPGEEGRPVRVGGLEIGRTVEAAMTRNQEVLAKPPVRRLAKDLHVDLTGVQATGAGGVITRADVERAARLTATATSVGGAVSGGGLGAPTRDPAQPRETRTPIKGVVKHMADAMVASAFTAPHVTEWVEVDVTRTLELVERLKARPELEGVRVSPLLLVAAGVLYAVRRHPGVNATWDAAAGEIVTKHYVNLGIAAATERGLIVPNVKDADALDLVGLARALHELVETARAGRTTPADMAGGTITITNVGVFGVDGGTPIINPGEAAILAMGRAIAKPWVVDGEVRVRQVMQLTLSFDHRMVDGALGSQVLADVARFLEDPAVELLLA